MFCLVVFCVAPSTMASTKRGTECFVLCYVQNVALSVLCCVASFLKGLYKTWHWMFCVVFASFLKDRYKTWHRMFCVVFASFSRASTKRGTECFVLCLLPSPRTATKRGTECVVLYCFLPQGPLQNVSLNVSCCVASFPKDRCRTCH